MDLRDLIRLIGAFFYIAIFARVILSWFPGVQGSNPVARVLYNVTEPVLGPVRRFLPKFGMLDLSPMVALLLILLVQELLLAAVG